MPVNSGVLIAEDVKVHFGGVKAVDGISLEVSDGEILGLIGPNGAGKTTMINAMSGFQTITSGRVVLAGQDASKWPPEKYSRNGLTRSFQEIRPFSRLTVFENVAVTGLAMGLNPSEVRENALRLLDLFELGVRPNAPATALSHGDRRRLGIARALATRPRFLLLDEPAAGLNEVESRDLVGLLRTIRDQFGVAIVLIEHDMSVVMNLCERIVVVDHGKPIASGSPTEIQADSVVLEVYLGSPATSGTQANHD